MATETKVYDFTQGPSELDFFVLSLARRQPVSFLTTEGDWVHIVITSVEAEDGSSKTWLFSGFLNNAWKSYASGARVKGFFSYTQGRIGWVKIDLLS